MILWIVLIWMSLSQSVFARAPIQEIRLTSEFQFSTEVLTTEKVSTLDPQLPNPHLQRWVLSRNLQMQGLKSFKRKGHKFGVSAKQLVGRNQGYVRGNGPWFFALNRFPCEKESNFWFSTEEGAREAVSEAHHYWNQLVEQRKVELSLLLERVNVASEQLALQKGYETFLYWLKAVDQEWRTKAPQKVREEEWKFYWKEAKNLDLCTGGVKKAFQPAPSVRDLMEPIPSVPPPTITQLVARAPARLWNGLLSIRLSVTIGTKNLDGKFLIDSGAPQSIISPTFLDAQGIVPTFIQLPGTAPGRVHWSEMGTAEGSLAPRVLVDKIRMSGLELPLREFLLFETDVFSPPENVGTCCDGILGVDFLSSYPMEFQTDFPYEVRVWPKVNFHWNEEQFFWTELSKNKEGRLESQCFLSPDDEESVASGKKESSLHLPGIQWESGAETALKVHTPWESTVKRSGVKSWKIVCDSVPIAERITNVIPNSHSEGSSPWKIPASSVGMPILARGNFTWDVPHGRIWLSRESFKKQRRRKNETGLTLAYVMNEGERELRVKQIRKNSRSQELYRLGLRPGMLITKIDDKDPADIDLWEVNQRLSGDFDTFVSLSWMTKKGIKVAPLKVRE